jgi:hypothetical protein
MSLILNDLNSLIAGSQLAQYQEFILPINLMTYLPIGLMTY